MIDEVGVIDKVFNVDCMIGMKEFPDKYFDLAIVDPPYGKNIDNDNPGNFVMTKHNSRNWDKAPSEEYFLELFRVSSNQIIWGGNYFLDFLTNTDCFVLWDKLNPLIGKFSDFEIAWTSFHRKPSMIYRQAWVGYGRKFLEKDVSIHPTQKPIKLYKWLLKNYAKEGDKILDTHLGSQSSRIAAFDMGFSFVGYELDIDYFNAGNKRFANYKAQLKLQL